MVRCTYVSDELRTRTYGNCLAERLSRLSIPNHSYALRYRRVRDAFESHTGPFPAPKCQNPDIMS